MDQIGKKKNKKEVIQFLNPQTVAGSVENTDSKLKWSSQLEFLEEQTRTNGTKKTHSNMCAYKHNPQHPIQR